MILKDLCKKVSGSHAVYCLIYLADSMLANTEEPQNIFWKGFEQPKVGPEG